MEPFVPHMSFLEAHRLQVGDKVDHRKPHGKFALATVIAKDPSRPGLLQLHYDGQNIAAVSSYTSELHRFAVAGSISRRPAHRLTEIREGSLVDIHAAQHPGWRKGEVVRVSSSSGQIQVT